MYELIDFLMARRKLFDFGDDDDDDDHNHAINKNICLIRITMISILCLCHIVSSSDMSLRSNQKRRETKENTLRCSRDLYI